MTRRRLTLSIDSDDMRYIPSNASVRIAGNTVFGAKSVEFVPPETPARDRRCVRTRTCRPRRCQLEVNTLFQTLIDVLHKVDPVDLNATLTALAEGLRGHGDDLGATLAGLNTLARPDQSEAADAAAGLPQTAAVVANIYGDAAPDLVTVLDNAADDQQHRRRPAGQPERDAAGRDRAGQQRL